MRLLAGDGFLYIVAWVFVADAVVAGVNGPNGPRFVGNRWPRFQDVGRIARFQDASRLPRLPRSQDANRRRVCTRCAAPLAYNQDAMQPELELIEPETTTVPNEDLLKSVTGSPLSPGDEQRWLDDYRLCQRMPVWKDLRESELRALVDHTILTSHYYEQARMWLRTWKVGACLWVVVFGGDLWMVHCLGHLRLYLFTRVVRPFMSALVLSDDPSLRMSILVAFVCTGRFPMISLYACLYWSLSDCPSDRTSVRTHVCSDNPSPCLMTKPKLIISLDVSTGH